MYYSKILFPHSRYYRHYTHFSEADIRSHVDAIKGFFAAPEDQKDNENDNDKNADY